MVMTSGERACEKIFEEQRQVLETLEGLQVWWAEARVESSPPVDELVPRIHDLRTKLANHFQRETEAERTAVEEQNCDASADRLNESIRGNAMLVAELDQVIERLRICRPGMDCWADVSQMFEHYLERLSHHEEAQMKLLAPEWERPTTPVVKGYVLPT